MVSPALKRASANPGCSFLSTVSLTLLRNGYCLRRSISTSSTPGATGIFGLPAGCSAPGVPCAIVLLGRWRFRRRGRGAERFDRQCEHFLLEPQELGVGAAILRFPF